MKMLRRILAALFAACAAAYAEEGAKISEASQSANAANSEASAISVSAKLAESPAMTLEEASAILSKTNLVTGVFIGYADEVSEQTFAIASIVRAHDTKSAIKILRDVYKSASNVEGKCYALMGLYALEDTASYRELGSSFDAKANINAWLNGKVYSVGTSYFFSTFEEKQSLFVPKAFPITAELKKLAADARADNNAAQADSQAAASSETVEVVEETYYPNYYLGAFPIAWAGYYSSPVVVINAARTRPPHPRPRPPNPKPQLQPKPQPAAPAPQPAPNGGKPPATGRPQSAPAQKPAQKPAARVSQSSGSFTSANGRTKVRVVSPSSNSSAPSPKSNPARVRQAPPPRANTAASPSRPSRPKPR